MATGGRLEQQSERDRLREHCTRELRELREADDDETTTPEVVVDAAARAAARTARQLSRPDSDAPARAWHETNAGKGAIGAVIAAVAGIIVAALRQAGLLK